METITGRSPKPLSKKLNPLWWFQNDDEQKETDPDTQWYHPDWPQWRRHLYWNYFRNPLQNFRAYVVGVSDRNYTLTGRAPVMTVQRDDLNPPERGFQWCVLKLGALFLPFVSYVGRYVVWYLGWQPSGFFGAKFNIRDLDWGRPRLRGPTSPGRGENILGPIFAISDHPHASPISSWDASGREAGIIGSGDQCDQCGLNPPGSAESG